MVSDRRYLTVRFSGSASVPRLFSVSLAFMTNTGMSFTVHKYNMNLHLKVILANSTWYEY